MHSQFIRCMHYLKCKLIHIFIKKKNLLDIYIEMENFDKTQEDKLNQPRFQLT